jgi:selenocysteine-specific elongation factor
MATAGHIDPKGGSDQIATDLLAIRGIDDLARLAAQSGGGRPAGAITVGSTAMTPDRFTALRDQAEQVVTEHHAAHPLRPGISSATLATSVGVNQDLVDRLVEESPILRRIGPDVTRIDHRQGLDEDMETHWSRAEAMLRSDLAVPVATELGLDPELLHLMIRNGHLVRISDDLVFLPEQIEQIVSIIEGMDTGFTVADFRDRTGLSRKYAVPVLEWSDKEGLTIRRGDQRHLR